MMSARTLGQKIGSLVRRIFPESNKEEIQALRSEIAAFANRTGRDPAQRR